MIASQHKGLIKAYLFGPYTKNINKRDRERDIDLALIIDNLEDNKRFDFQVQLMMSASDFDIRIEPHPISYKDFTPNNPFVAEILKTGIEIEPKAPNIW